MNILLFSGGSGTTLIAETLANNQDINLSLVINGYDDGKSTGVLRSFIPGMLGPSDFRKNSNNFCKNPNLKFLLDHRIKTNNFLSIKNFLLDPLSDSKNLNKQDLKIKKYLLLTTLDESNKIFESFKFFFNYQSKVRKNINMFDCSIGNIVFSGLYLKNQRKFNKTVDEYNNLCGSNVKIYNVSNGLNAYLYGIDSTNKILDNEEKIVNLPKNKYLKEIFLLKKKIQNPRIEYLRNNQFNPDMNADLKKILLNSDVIIYGPGTQFSSLLPSYLTKNIGKYISTNKQALKVFVSNIKLDNDIQSLSVNDIFDKSFFYLNNKGKTKIDKNKLFTNLLIQKSQDNVFNKNFENYLNFNIDTLNFDKKKVHTDNWEKSSGKHLGEFFHNYIIKSYNKKFKKNIKISKNSISIVVLIKDEVNFIKKLLSKIEQIKSLKLKVPYEIIFIDGGSKDGSLKKLRKLTDTNIYSFNNLKRGEALSKGFDIARGELIVTYPSDCEYSVSDLQKIIEYSVSDNCSMVIGSRNIRNSNFTTHIDKIYKNKKISFLLSKYGGILISFLTLIFYNRFITDPFSTLKVYDKESINKITLREKGVNFDIEIICKLLKINSKIVEIPINYYPRGKKEGKKMGVIDGIFSLKTLLVNIFS